MAIHLVALRAALHTVFPPLLALALLSGAVEIWVRLAGVSKLVMPLPSSVFVRLWIDRGLLLGEGAITLGEALGGFLAGTCVAFALAVVMAYSRPAERALMPPVLLIKVTPVFATAPLFIIWFGFGLTPKILTAALFVFFPVLVGALTGFRSVNPRVLEFLRSINASPREVFFKLRLPSSAPYVLSSFRTAVPLSVIGAVVAEYFNQDRGLGRLVFLYNINLDTAGLFASIIVLAVIGVLLTWILGQLEQRLLFWHESRQDLAG